MKDFGKKIFSAVMALAMTASMSVYAEAPSSVENDEKNVQFEVAEALDSAANETFASTNSDVCFHDPSASTTVSPATYVGHHKAKNGATCVIMEYTITTTTVCKKCGKTISTAVEKRTTHSVCDNN